MKKTLLITILFLSFTVINAQQFRKHETINATWEESIDWINSKLKDGGEFQAAPFGKNNLKFKYVIDYSGKIKEYCKSDDISWYCSKSANLFKSLKGMSAHCDTSKFCDINIEFDDEVVSDFLYPDDKGSLYDYFSVAFKYDTEAKERMGKAFNHLVELTKKRKAMSNEKI